VVWKKIQLTDKYWTEAPVVADLNKDGHPDIIVGPYWFEGPNFKKRHEFRPATQSFSRTRPDGSILEVEGYSTGIGNEVVSDLGPELFATAVDLNNDGWPDILLATPSDSSKRLVWYENPGRRRFNKLGFWRSHVVADNVDNESVEFIDLFRNGHPVLLAMSGGLYGRHAGRVGYFQPDPNDALRQWNFHPISQESEDYQWYSHGLGAGDVNGDGRIDVLASDGWWEQPASVAGDPIWRFHPFPFNLGPGQIKQNIYLSPENPLPIAVTYDVSADGVPTPMNVYGGSVMHVDDVNGDGLADIICSLSAHGYGLVWWEQLKGKSKLGDVEFKRHIIMDRPGDTKHGVSLTEMQAVEWFDVDGDGRKDIVTGKRFWTHKDGDPGAREPAALYWLRQTRTSDGTIDFVPYEIDDDSGAGNHIAIADVNGDAMVDLVTANRKGAFLFLQLRHNKVSASRKSEN
jgi:hypothetical protein